MEVAKLPVAQANNVYIIDKAFYMPQLNRYRRIWLYVPPDYKESKKHYPVLYMQDGQNLFEQWSAFGEEWGVDETLNAAKTKCIVVGIDNGVDRRLNEYTIHDNERYGIGEGALYLSFLVNTLKPYIDETYRTLPERENTFVAGSSLGGLISFYACLYYPETFGAAGLFSPAFWIAPALQNDLESKSEHNKEYPQRFYFYYGEKEGPEMVVPTKAILDVLENRDQYSVNMVADKEGAHRESDWRNAFPAFYKWIMNKDKKQNR